MGQRARIFAEILDVPGWKVLDVFWENSDGERVLIVPIRGLGMPTNVTLVLRVARRWAPRCCRCDGLGEATHERLEPRRWRDLPCGSHPVAIDYAPVRIKCRRCGAHSVEHLPWAEPYQRQTKRLQQQLALDAASMPVVHVAAKYRLGWNTVRRAEGAALARWDATRKLVPLEMVGVDEKYLGRRHKLPYDYVTIVSNLATGEPVWIGPGRDAETLTVWLRSLTRDAKKGIKLFAMDAHAPFRAAIRGDPDLTKTPIVHDPFHIVKRANEAVDDIRRAVFFRAGDAMRAVGRGTRWLFLKAWERCTPKEELRVRELLAQNRVLARAYQVKEELRGILMWADAEVIKTGIDHLCRRIQSRDHKPLRKFHDFLKRHRERIADLGKYDPPTGRIEALNNNWETLVRRARGYRDYAYLLLKLKFMTANPVRSPDSVARFLSLGLRPSAPARAA